MNVYAMSTTTTKVQSIHLFHLDMHGVGERVFHPRNAFGTPSFLRLLYRQEIVACTRGGGHSDFRSAVESTNFTFDDDDDGHSKVPRHNDDVQLKVNDGIFSLLSANFPFHVIGPRNTLALQILEIVANSCTPLMESTSAIVNKTPAEVGVA